MMILLTFVGWLITLTFAFEEETPSGLVLCELAAYSTFNLNSLNLTGWECDNTGIPIIDHCLWDGIECSGNDISKINLKGFGVDGTLPMSIGFLQSLEVLNIQENKFRGQLPESLGDLTGLRVLNINSNHFSGTFPETIAKLRSLLILNAYNNGLTGTIPNAFGTLPLLRSMYLNKNDLHGTLPIGVTRVLPLKHLDVSDNSNLVGELKAEYCTAIINIHQLGISRTGVKCVSPCFYDRGILRRDEPGDIFPICEDDVKWLRKLQVAQYIPEPEQITEFQSLCALIKSTNIGALPHFVVGDSWKCAEVIITTGALPVLLPVSNPCYNWHHIYCSGDSIVSRATDSAPHIISLQLAFQSISGSLPEEIGNFRLLESLHLDHNSLTGTIPSSIVKLTNLLSLNLNDNSLTGTLPPTIGAMKNLINLNLNDNHLNGLLPWSLGELSTVNFLYLHNNDFAGSIPDSVVNMGNVELAYLQNNKFTGTLPFTTVASAQTHNRANEKLKYIDASTNGISCFFNDLLSVSKKNVWASKSILRSIGRGNVKNEESELDRTGESIAVDTFVQSCAVPSAAPTFAIDLTPEAFARNQKQKRIQEKRAKRRADLAKEKEIRRDQEKLQEIAEQIEQDMDKIAEVEGQVEEAQEQLKEEQMKLHQERNKLLRKIHGNALELKSCPNNCSGQGTCSNDVFNHSSSGLNNIVVNDTLPCYEGDTDCSVVCTCNPGVYGADCGIDTTQVASDTSGDSENVVAASINPGNSPALAAHQVAAANRINQCFAKCIVYPRSRAGETYTAEMASQNVVAMETYIGSNNTDVNAKFCALFAGSRCTSQSLADGTCNLPCLAGASECADPLCDVFTKLSQICPSNGRIVVSSRSAYNVTRHKADKKQCLKSAVANASVVIPVIDFSIGVKIAGWDSLDDFLSEHESVRALVESLVSIVPGVLDVTVNDNNNVSYIESRHLKSQLVGIRSGIDSSSVDEVYAKHLLGGSHKTRSLYNSISERLRLLAGEEGSGATPVGSIVDVMLSITSIPDGSAGSYYNSVEVLVDDLNDLIAEASFSRSFITGALEANSPTVTALVSAGSGGISDPVALKQYIKMPRSTDLVDSIVPLQVLTVPHESSIKVLQTASPTVAPTVAIESFASSMTVSSVAGNVVRHAKAYIYVIIGVSAVCLLYLGYKMWTTNVTVRNKHNEPIDFGDLDKLFPPAPTAGTMDNESKYD